MTQIYKKSVQINKETDEKIYTNPVLSKDELIFLYEIDSTIHSFGYDKDPRIKEIRNTRNLDEDIQTIFECTKDQLATSPNEVNENTKAYIGEWNPTIYQTIQNYPNITHLYESFPDKKIFTYELATDTSIKSPEQAKQKLESKGIWISDYGKGLLEKTEFSQEQTQYKLVQFTVKQLGFSQDATTDQIYTKAQELGLKLCPAEVGPLLRLSYEGKDWKLIAMKQIIGRDGYPSVFNLGSGAVKLWLDGNSAYPVGRWSSDYQFVFLAS